MLLIATHSKSLNATIVEQAELNFNSPSPINAEKLTGQNKRLYDWLNAGNTIHCMSKARIDLCIGYTNSRISDLKKIGITIYKRNITVNDAKGEPTTVKEYSLKPFEKK